MKTKTPAELLLTVTPAHGDRRVAMMTADKIVFYSDAPYRFQIDHDIRPPHCKPCPVEYGWSVKDKVGIQIKNSALARKWLTDALLHGYKVEEVDGHRKPTNRRTESIEIVRRRAEIHQQPKQETEDDIPF